MFKKLLGTACIILAASSVQAQSFQSTDDAIEYRQSAFTVCSAYEYFTSCYAWSSTV